ncbi:hypothetical protein BH20ACT19_BH20ACT19_11720 [soil metagenome]
MLAGALGTVAMTVSSTLDAKLRDRPGSSAPSDAAGKVLGVQPRDEDGQARFSNVVHWSYGTSWGAARGVIAHAGLAGIPATAAHFGAVWGSSLVMLPGLGVAPPVWKQSLFETTLDAFHHAVYAAATTVAWSAVARD